MQDVIRLAGALAGCQPLLASAAPPLRVFPVDGGAPLDEAAVVRGNAALAALGAARGLTTPRLVAAAPARPSSLEVAVSRFCDLDPDAWRAIGAAAAGGLDFDLELGLDDAPTGAPVQRDVAPTARPGFASFAAGPDGDEAIVVIPPCGIPAALFRPWLAALSSRRRVITFENPYLFGAWRALPEPSGELAHEAAYVGAVLDAHGIARAHVVGICGGAPIALAAAAELGPRVASVIVCHADLNFGAETPRTPFQKQFQGFLSEATTSVARAGEIHRLFLDPNILFGIPVRLAPYILYPYGDLGLFRRYATINHGLMVHDASATARALVQRLLVVTSRRDRITHPAASHRLHQDVAGSSLWERDQGSHHDILLPDPALFAAIAQFVDGGAA